MMLITSFTSPVFSSNPFFLVFVRDTAKEENYTLTSCPILFISWLPVLMYSQSLSEESARYLGINCSQGL